MNSVGVGKKWVREETKPAHCLGNKISKSHKGPEVDKRQDAEETPNTSSKNIPVCEFSPRRAPALCVADTECKFTFIRMYFKGHLNSLRQEPWGVEAQRVGSSTSDQKWLSLSSVPPASVRSMPAPCTDFANPTLLLLHQTQSQIWL